MKPSLILPALTFLVLTSASLPAADCTVTRFNWLSGRWTGQMNGAVSEEIWSLPEGDSMMGMWRLVSKGATRIFEFATIVSNAQGTTLNLRHFSARMEGWPKEKEQPLALTSCADGEIVFAGKEGEVNVKLTYLRTASGGLSVTLDKDGKKHEYQFVKQ